MENTNKEKNPNVINKQEGIGIKRGIKGDKGAVINKRDVDEYDISEEYFTKPKLESDGEDF